jgi:DNA-binding GntR family transcriptional regulator
MGAQTNHLSNALRPIRVPSAPAAAAEALRNGILAGDLKPGERLIEQKLARRMRIGQPTLREALKELEHQGFVRKGAQRGTYVTKLTREDFRHILEVRMTLEIPAIEKAAARITAGTEAELRALVDAMELAARNFDLNTFHRIDMEFHRRVWALGGNPYLAEALELVAFRLFAFVLLQRGRDSQGQFLAATDQHRAILAGLATHDPERAREAFVANTVQFWNDHHGVDLSPRSLRISALGADKDAAPEMQQIAQGREIRQLPLNGRIVRGRSRT